MWRGLTVARDTVLFLMGTGIIVQQLWSQHPDATILGIGTTLTGVPAWLHNRRVSAITSNPAPSASGSAGEQPPSPSSNSSGGN